MKIIAISLFSLALLLGVTTSAHASVYLIDGKYVTGYVGGAVALPPVEQVYVQEVDHPVEVKQPLVGNTRINDMITALLITDVPAFLEMVHRAGIQF